MKLFPIYDMEHPSFTTITFYLIVLRTNPFVYNIDSMSYGGVHLSKI
jgi:hypothetical protein